MKQHRQIIIWFLMVVILTSMFLLVLPRPALAQTIYSGCELVESEESISKPIIINFSLPGITTKVGGEYKVRNLPCFIIGLYTYFAGVAGILATVMIMFGGIKYVVSFGSPQKISDAKDTIFAALSGLVLMLGAYVLLNFINPNLTELKMPDIKGIKEVPDYFCDPADKDKIVLEEGWGCGMEGTLNGVKCIITDRSSCSDYEYGILMPANYDPYFNGPFVCAQGSPNNPDENKDGWNCMTAQQRCERWDDTRGGVGLGRHDALCSEQSIEGKGECRWYDVDWKIPDTPGSQITTDRCRWWGALECDPYNIGTWFRVGCSACNAAGDDGICPPIMSNVGNLPVIGWTAGIVIDLTGTESNVVCEVDSKTLVYYTDPSSDGKKRRGICCRRMVPNMFRCYNGQDYDNLPIN